MLEETAGITIIKFIFFCYFINLGTSLYNDKRKET